jgi:hypothetical protein
MACQRGLRAPAAVGGRAIALAGFLRPRIEGLSAPSIPESLLSACPIFTASPINPDSKVRSAVLNANFSNWAKFAAWGIKGLHAKFTAIIEQANFRLKSATFQRGALRASRP